MKRFPIQGGGWIPWSLAVELYEVYAQHFGRDQSLDLLAERGGFGFDEIVLLHHRTLRNRRVTEEQRGQILGAILDRVLSELDTRGGEKQ